MKTPSGGILAGVSALAVGVAVVAGLMVLGSPAEERTRRTDERRVRDLQAIRAATDLYWTRHDRVPASLQELMDEPGVSISGRDPVTGEAYSFQALDGIRYEVCATFEGETEEISRDPALDLWAHGPGRQCFELDAKEVDGEASERRPDPPRGPP